MKWIMVVLALSTINCATAAPQAKRERVESFYLCMRYDEDITLTADKELELFEYCMENVE